MRRPFLSVSLTAVVALWWFSVFAAEPWIITGDVVITEPTDVGDVIVAGAGSLTVRDLPEPGLRVAGNLWAVGNASVRLENSVVQFMSTYHGQYVLAGIDEAKIEVAGCDYRVPNGVQHGLVVGGEAEMLIEDTEFGDVQLVSLDTAGLTGRRLNGNFEVIVQDDSTMELADIPDTPEAGRIWVWVEFPNGSVAEYTPPMPGFVSYDRGRLLADQTPVNTTPALGGDGVIAVTFIVNPPDSPPVAPTTLTGTVGLFTLGEPVLESWRLEGIPRRAGHAVPIADGVSNVEENEIAIWSGADPGVDQLLRTVLTDSWGRKLVGRVWVLGNGPRARWAGPRISAP